MSSAGFASRLLRKAGRLAARANPFGFLERRMLREHPLLWRCAFVHVVWYVALAWAVAWAAGRFMPLSAIDPPTTLTLAGVYSQMMLVVLIALAAWIFSMSRHPLSCASRGVAAATFLAIWAAAHLALTAPSAFSAAALPRIAALGDGWDFDDHAAVLEPANYGACFAPETLEIAPSPGEPALEETLRALRPTSEGLLSALDPVFVSAARSAAARFDIDVRGATNWCIDAEGQRLCPRERSACLDLARGQSNLQPGALADRMATIRQARLHRDGDAQAQGEVFWPFSAVSVLLSLFVALVAAWLTFRRSGPSRRDGVRSDVLAPAFRVVGYAPRWLRRWDRTLLRTRPALWAMRTHMVTLFATAAAFTLVGAGAGLFVYIDNFVDENVYLPFYITLCFVFGLSAAGLSAGYQKRFDLELDTPGRVARALLSVIAPFAPVAAATLAIVALLSQNRLDEDVARYLWVPGVLLFMGAVSGAIASFLARLFGGRRVFVMLVVVGMANLSIFFFEPDSLEDFLLGTTLFVWSMALATSLALRLRGPATSRLLLLAAMAQTPWLAFYLGFLGVDVLFRPLGLPSDLEELVATAVTMLGPVLIVGVLLRPVYPVLVDMRIEPKEQ